MPVFSILIASAGSLNKVKKFVQTGELQRTLSALGEVELEAAKLALSSANIAQDPTREVHAAVTHLQSAHVAFKNKYCSKEFITLPDEHKAANVDVWICCLMAMCYRYLNEEKLVQKCLDEAGAAIRVIYPGVFGRVGRMFTWKGWKQGAAVYIRPFHHFKAIFASEVDKGEFENFRSTITKSITPGPLTIATSPPARQ
jgi:hypothetical protein